MWKKPLQHRIEKKTIVQSVYLQHSKHSVL